MTSAFGRTSARKLRKKSDWTREGREIMSAKFYDSNSKCELFIAQSILEGYFDNDELNQASPKMN